MTYAQGMILLAVFAVGCLALLSGCATRYQPPGGGLYVAVKYEETQRSKP